MENLFFVQWMSHFIPVLANTKIHQNKVEEQYEMS